MKPNQSKLKYREETQAELQRQSAQQQATLEFATVEDLLRYDAAQVAPPPGIARRLSESLGHTIRRVAPWWQRFFRS
jgi:hypothetical protein